MADDEKHHVYFWGCALKSAYLCSLSSLPLLECGCVDMVVPSSVKRAEGERWKPSGSSAAASLHICLNPLLNKTYSSSLNSRGRKSSGWVGGWVGGGGSVLRPLIKVAHNNGSLRNPSSGHHFSLLLERWVR